MNSNLLSYLVSLVLLLALQILVLNNIQISGFLNPFLYIYLIIVLPVSFPRIGVLFMGFGLGLALDVFHQTLGMHAVATTFLAYCRPFILQYMAPRDGYEFSRVPGIRDMGYLWFGTYAAIMVFLHHFMLFFIEAFRLSGFWFTLGKVIGSTLLTFLLVLVVQLLFSGRASNKSGYD